MKATQHHLPRYLDDFIGRTRDLEKLSEALQRYALISIVGFGGVGKTRLAIEFSRQHREDFKDGIYFFDAYNSKNTNVFISNMAKFFDITDVKIEMITEFLVEYFQNKRILLIFDNMEHLPEIGLFIKNLLAECPTIKILVTSRERLKVRGECVYKIHPFNFEALDTDLSNNEAIQMFYNRARMADPELPLTPENQQLMFQICALLEGIPLSIELVASQVFTHSLPSILKFLQDNQLLQDHPVSIDLDDRQRSMRNLIDWSYQLLEKEQQLVFRYLNFFEGKFDLDETLHILQVLFEEQHIQADPRAVVTSLMEKNLLYQKVAGDGRAMLFFLDVVKVYARTLTPEHEQHKMLDLYTRYYVRRIQQNKEHAFDVQSEYFSAHASSIHQIISANLQNHPMVSARLVSYIWKYWQASRFFYLGLTYCDSLYEAYVQQEGQQDNAEFALSIVNTLIGAAWISNDNFDFEGSRKYFSRALEVAQQHQNLMGMAGAYQGLAHLCLFWGDLDRADEFTVQAQKIIDQIGEPDQKFWIQSHTGRLLFVRGQFAEAEKCFLESRAGFYQRGNTWGMAWSQLHLAELYFETNQLDRADAVLNEQLENSQLSFEEMNTVRLHLLLLVAKLNVSMHRIDQAKQMLQICLDYFSDKKKAIKVNDLIGVQILTHVQDGQIGAASALIHQVMHSKKTVPTINSLIDINYCAALIGVASKQYSEARKMYQLCLQIHHQFAWAITPRRQKMYEALEQQLAAG